TADDFRKLVISRGADGYLVRLGDVAKIEIAPETLRDSFTADGKNAIGIGISRQSTANTLAMIRGVKETMKEIKKELPKDMEMAVLKDSSVFIEASVNEVLSSLLIAALLVIGIIFIFLGSFRAAIVPAVTVPIALISAFIVLYAMGYSVNLLTLLALVLAIGLVVDDSIVVLENIHRRIEEGEPTLLAAYRGAREVGFAVVATTLVLVAVFIPISMMEGDTGKLFTEFAFAITGAVIFSSVVALTLSPMLCSKILRPKKEDSLLSKLDEAIFKRIISIYERILRRLVNHPYISLATLIILCGMVWVLLGRLQAEFEPQEDRAVLLARMTAPEGTSFEASSGYMKKASKVMNELIESDEARHVLSITPGNRNRSGAVNSGFGVIELKLWDQRKRNAQEITRELFPKLQSVPGIRMFVIQPSGISMFFGQPVQFVIGGPTYEELVKWRDIIVSKAKEYPGLIGVDVDYKETTPQYRIAINRDRAAELGVSSETIGRTLETIFGSKQVTTYIEGGEEYDVILQGTEEDRRTPSDLQNIYVRSSRGQELIPLSNLVTLEERADASTLNRYNRVRAITISGSVADGYSLDDCLKFLEHSVREDLPSTATINYKGMSQKFKEASGSIVFVFILSMVIAYFVLCAQFESFVSPVVIMMTVPMGVLGALAGMLILGVTLNIYSQIGLVMLIGLAAKNGILIVEFANQLRDRGVEFEEAVFQASAMRLRPIAMTGLSTAIGALPLIFASGAGAMSRIAIGSVIFFGATSACLLTMFVVPVGYFYLSRSQASPKELEHKIDAMSEEHE
ncbi:MAG: efflux RND transporter permease subunit, partial [Planctomycetes bacterium]|nr:efflux RND transporter permease subunit [Planctomycetota bacterium]